MATLTPSPKFYVPGCENGSIKTYEAGTTTPLATYTDSTGGTPNPTTITLDARGEFGVWLDSAKLYKFEAYNSTGSLLWTVDNVGGVATLNALAASSGSTLVNFLQAGTGAAARTVQSKLRDTLSVKDFGAVGDGVTNDTAAIQSALTAAGVVGNTTVLFPAGIYLFDSTLTLSSGVRIQGAGGRRGVTGLKSNVIGSVSINVANGFYQAIEDINLFHATPASANTGIQLIDNDGGGGTDPAQYFLCRNVRIKDHATGVRIANESTWCAFDDVIAEGCSGAAFSLTNANFTIFNRCIADGCDSGWFLDSTTKTILDNCTAQVCASTTTAAVSILNCDNVEVNHLWCERNEFHNVHVRGTSRLTRITEMLNQGAGYSGGPGRGIFVDGTASNTIIDGGWHGGNTTEDITIGATTTKTGVIYPRSTTTLTITDSSNDASIIEHGQFKFPATQNPSSNKNTLDDYEEDDWTPAYGTTGVGFTAVTYDAITGGKYIKIGRFVHVQGAIRTDSITVGAATGSITISLPFPTAANTGSTVNGQSSLTVGYAQSFLGEEPLSILLNANASTGTLYYRNAVDGDVAALQVADMDTGANTNYIYFSGTYIAAA